MFEQRGHAAADEDGRHPATLVDALLEEDAVADGVANEGERSDGWSDQAHIRMAQSEEK